MKNPFFSQQVPVFSPLSGRFFLGTSLKCLICLCIFECATQPIAQIRQVYDLKAEPRLATFFEERAKQDLQTRRFDASKEPAKSLKMSKSPQSEVAGQDYDDGRFEQDTAPEAQSYQTRGTDTWSSAANTPRTGNALSGRETGSDFFDSDDASPTPSEYRNDVPPTQPGQPKLSAWEWIRQKNAPSSRAPTEYAHARQQAKPDFSSYASEKQQERERAQAEFDKMLEAERNRSD